MRDSIITSLNVAICQGENYQVGNQIYTQTGRYRQVLNSLSTGCDSTVILDLLVLNPRIRLLDTPIINCYQPTVTLDARPSLSTQSPPIYRWTNALGQVLSQGPELNISTGGSLYIGPNRNPKGAQLYGFSLIYRSGPTGRTSC
ncbi:MAG: hypothetical protein HC821_03450 [Lewinella sp.]|nr:hypothetical protein [Lewinella sp.]